MVLGDDEPARKFIETEPIGRAGEDCEGRVWEACKKAFASRDCIGYWKYPIFFRTGERRREPDILIVDREIGIVIIEVKGLRIHQIQSVDGPSWIYCDFYEQSGNPNSQAENYLFAILAYTDREILIRRQVRGRVIVALPQITEEEWQNQGWDQRPGCPPILFGGALGQTTLLHRIINTPLVQPGCNLTDEQWETLLSVIGGYPVMRKPQIGTPPQLPRDRPSRAEIVNTLRDRLHELDLQQTHIGLEIPPGMQRIRGIAGSGKTVLLCQKAANIHLKHPEWDIALVFFTRSLYDQMEELVDRWLRHFSVGEVRYRGNDRTRSKLKILHAWGANNRSGFYRYICEQHHVRPMTVANTAYRQPSEGLADVCRQLMDGRSLNQLFDVVLIDEGQDLVVDLDELKYEREKQSIYWMAYQVLRPCDPDNPSQRRLIWAYDEAQSLHAQTVPSMKELFGPELGKLVSERYEGGIKPSEVMHRCYRTPGPILTAAHALGMGLLRPEGMVSGLTRKEHWEAIGYECEGDFRRRGSQIRLRHPPKNSPSPVPSLWPEPVIQFRTYNNRQQELEALAQNIHQNISRDNLSPSHQILVLVLAERLHREVARFLMDREVDVFIPSGTRLNQLNPRYPDNDPDAFWYSGGITVSRIARAKGNEAEMVYIIGLDNVASQEENVLLRNQLFVALTRARCWATMTGTGYYPFYDEIKAVLQAGNTFEFIYNRPPRRDLTDSEE